jgi:chromosome segregation ATPase
MVGGINSLEKSSREIESSIVSCFRSDEEYSLISQLKLIRQEIVDTRKEVSSSFKDFAEQIAESSTDALVEALEKVVGDFNTLLNELVGESFKELSTSMIKLNEWQENYKTHVDETQGKVNNLINQMTATVKVLDSSSSSIDKIDNSLESIDSTISGLTVSAEDISAHIESLSLQNETLREGLTSIKQVGDEAKTVMPTIETQINNLTNKLESTVLNVAEKFESSSTIVTEFVDDAARKIGTASDCHSQTVQKFIEGIDEGLEMELSKAMNIISSNLGSLSAKFVEDYMPLTERLREIVRLPERIDA